MAEYYLSYLVTTYNKLPYLQQVMEQLLATRLPDEEIVVADGGSTDGTGAYLQALYEAGQIQQFVSERDKGESHGFNKTMLMARGELLKVITDDDAFCYPAIREAAAFMLAHPEIDVLTGNTGLLHLEQLSELTLYEDVAANFQRWLNHGEPVWMIGLPLLIRRKSLALTGLFNTGVVQADTEFTYRITSLKGINLAWSTAMLSTRIENPQSNFRVMGRQNSQEEADRIRFFYDKTIGPGFAAYLRHKSGWWEAIKTPIRPLKRLLFDLLALPQYQGHIKLPTGYTPMTNESGIAASFRVANGFMVRHNVEHPTEFLYKKQLLTKALLQ